MSIRQLDEAAIFSAARKIDALEARERYLREVCGDDVVLRDRVATLLRAHTDDGSFLESPAVSLGPAADMAAVSEKPGATIGPYKLLEQIGSGGMGLVFMAEQQRPMRRLVALKIIKPGMDTRQVIARFEAERQALALMDHPNIAKVLDAGDTGSPAPPKARGGHTNFPPLVRGGHGGVALHGDPASQLEAGIAWQASQAGKPDLHSGRPYFVMELVRGIPVTDYCDQARLPTRERLQLFITICEAVQHAHQKGIIHRDLKPSNILVTMHDDKAVPKVIDFGVAKATNQRLVEQTLFTNFAQMIGTPTYMSPEQAQMSGLDVDTRSDVYSLGVLLYELMTGTTPFEKKRLHEAGYDEMRRIIRDEEPPRPSARVTSLDAASQSTIALNRTLDRRKFSQALRGDLDWIVMKALEKDRTRRYESMGALIADARRYLADEPVEACPPSAGYRLRKIARRNKTALLTSFVVLTALVAGTGVASWQAFEANRARKLADDQLLLANQRLRSEQQARREADDERKRATRERKQSEANLRKAVEAVERMGTHVGDESLRNVPQTEQLQKQILREVVDFYERFLAESGDPNLRFQTAKAYMRLVDLHTNFGDVAEAQNALTLANRLFLELHAEQPDDRQIQFELADSYTGIGLYSAAGSAEQERHFRRANELLTPLLENQPPGEQSDEYRKSLAHNFSNLGGALRAQRRFDESELMIKNGLALCAGRDGFEHARATNYQTLAAVMEDIAHDSEAIGALEQALQERQKAVDQSPGVVKSQWYCAACGYDLGAILMRARRTERAVPHLQKAIAAGESFVRDFPTNAQYRHFLRGARITLVRAYHELGRSEDALLLARQLDTRTMDEYWERAELYETIGGTADAIADFEPSVEFSPESSAYWNSLGIAHYVQKDYVRATLALQKALSLDARNRTARRYLYRIYAARGEFEKVLVMSAEGIALDPAEFDNWVHRGEAYDKLGQYGSAICDYTLAMERDPTAWWIQKRRALAHFKLAHFDEALADIAQAVEINASDISNLTWIDPAHVAACPNAAFREGILRLADKTVERATSPDASFHEGMLRLLDKSGARTGGQAPAFAARGSLYAAMKQYDKALADMAKAIELDSRNAELHNRVAWYLVTCPDPNFRDVGRALNFARRATELDQNRGFFWNTLGVVMYCAGDWAPAVRSLERSMELRSGGDSFDWFFVAMAHWQLGHKEEARKWYGQAVQWMDKNKPQDEELRRFRAEAEELLNAEAQTGP